jgi:hypothetical protein
VGVDAILICDDVTMWRLTQVCLTGFVVLFTQGAMIQVCFSLFVQVLCVWLIAHLQPYSHVQTARSQQLVHVMLVYTFLGYALLSWNATNPPGQSQELNQEAFGILLVLIVALVFFISLAIVVILYSSSLKKGRFVASAHLDRFRNWLVNVELPSRDRASRPTSKKPSIEALRQPLLK